MKTNYTQGPWEIQGTNIKGEILIGKKGEKDNTGKIVRVGWNYCGADSDEYKHNATLIAAAPDLLEAAINIYVNASDMGETHNEQKEEFDEFKKLRLAIEKAGGTV